ncbi:MAG: Uma2 family endonuclease [Leptolyngbyaceae cyanobacterium bins.349]|nr:Uma2 family endonuclease [Leptolyngbyaceae cyanobacterium bins.349]
MTIATKRFSFVEYLAYDDGTDTRYELVDGELVEMGVGTGLHGAILKYLEKVFEVGIARLGLLWVSLAALVSVRSPRSGRWDTSRIPDVVMLLAEQWQAMRQREAVVELNDPAPLLVVEVVSESTKTTDYRYKQVEYAVRDIPEYWVVDPLAAKVTVFTLLEGMYDRTEFTGSDPSGNGEAARLQSPTFSDLQLTAAQILNAGEVV